jgi:CBS domain containing-hemolysin-like protein
MKIRQVSDIMIPLNEYTTVSEDTSLHDAVRALYKVQAAFKKNKYGHKAILVYNRNSKHITGKISALDIIKALEPNYQKIGKDDPAKKKVGLSRFGLSPDYLKSLISQYNLWDEPLELMITKAMSLKVKDFMYTPSDGEYVDEDASLAEAIHQLIIGQHQSLIVVNKNSNNEMTGILRLVDIFSEVCDLILDEN